MTSTIVETAAHAATEAAQRRTQTIADGWKRYAEILSAGDAGDPKEILKLMDALHITPDALLADAQAAAEVKRLESDIIPPDADVVLMAEYAATSKAIGEEIQRHHAEDQRLRIKLTTLEAKRMGNGEINGRNEKAIRALRQSHPRAFGIES